MDLTQLSQLLTKMTQQNYLSGIKAAVGIAACLLIYYEAQAEKPIPTRVKQIVGAVLAVAAIACFFQFFHLSYKGYYHRWELFHYYMGSKYAKELSYERIYVCAAIADAETGNLKVVKHRKLRDLRVNTLVPSSEYLAHPEQCKDHFTPEKWESFKSDLIWFRNAAGNGSWWNDMQKDHGYNPPPVWTIAGHYFSLIQPANDGFFKQLAAIDVTLTALMFIAIGWAFGWRILLVGVIFWGIQEPAPFYWTGGAFLRQDWFFLAVLAACLARKKWLFWAGFCLMYAGLLRVFPLVLWGGPGVVVLAAIWRYFTRRGETADPRTIKALPYSDASANPDADKPSLRELWDKVWMRHARLIAGGVVALAILFPWSLHVADGMTAWKEFTHHISVHNNTPLTNHMGLKTVIATSPSGRMKYSRDNRLLDPFERWKEDRRVRFHKYQFVYWGVIAAFAGMLALACWRIRSIWVAMALSLILVVSLVEATCYYYSIWILAALLTRLRPSMGQGLVSVFYGTLLFLVANVLARSMKDSLAIALVLGAGGVIYYVYHDAIAAFGRSKYSMEIAVIGLGALSQLLTVQFYFIDDKFTVMSAVYVAWTAAFLWAFIRKPQLSLGAEGIPVRSS
ncbi:MAG: hypothetical protein HY898_13335 [Deltaproteobacteria bacterium]|nr:hypothetical protein [Deltaproteobacteria bacterium]